MNLNKVSGLIKEKPAKKVEIEKVEDEMNIVLPKDYKKLLKKSNGFSTESGLVIYGTDSLLERNLTLEVGEYATGYIAIGDDSGDDIFLLSVDEKKREILVVDAGDMNPENTMVIAKDLITWIKCDCKTNDLNSDDDNHRFSGECGIVLIENPQGGLRDLAKIKSRLNIELSSAELLRASKHLPFILVKNISYGKATNYLNKLREFQHILKIVEM